MVVPPALNRAQATYTLQSETGIFRLPRHSGYRACPAATGSSSQLRWRALRLEQWCLNCTLHHIGCSSHDLTRMHHRSQSYRQALSSALPQKQRRCAAGDIAAASDVVTFVPIYYIPLYLQFVRRDNSIQLL